MQQFMLMFLMCSVTMSVLALCYMAMLPLLTKRYSEKGRYYAWLIYVIGLIIPFRPRFSNAFIEVSVMGEAAATTFQAGSGTMVTIHSPIGNTVLSQALPSISVWQIASMVWIAGVVVFLAYHVVKHYNFMKMVKRWSENITDEQTIAILDSLKAEMRITKRVGICRCQSIGSPMMVGMIHPLILLPKANLAYDELRLILKHELVHYKRKDLYFKSIVVLATALHWFNPVIYLVARAINIQCELSCDAETVKHADADTRQHYSETIIGVVKYQSRFKTVLSTNFYGGKQGMKNRITSIFDTRKKRAGFIVVSVVLVLTLGTGVAFAVGSLTPVSSSGVPDEFVHEGSISRAPKAGGGVADINATSVPRDIPEDEADINPPFDNWRTFLTYDYEMGVYRYEGKWVRSCYDEWKNPESWNGWSAILVTIGYDDESKQFIAITDFDNGESTDIRTVRNQETDVVEGVKTLSQIELQQLMEWLPYANEIDFDTFVSGG